jgi:pimeloyl-ACP methyl ester carboxylesterase
MGQNMHRTLLRHKDQGHGSPALVFLHYFGGSSRAWAGVVSELEGEHRCIRPDLRGFGCFETGSDAEYTEREGNSRTPFSGNDKVNACIDDHVEDVLNLLHGLRCESYMLVGHSMGGKIAMALAARQPPGLQALVLLAPSPPTPEPMTQVQRRHSLAHQMSQAAAETSARSDVAKALPKPLCAQVIEDRFCCMPSAWNWWLTSGSLENISASMGRVRVPVSVLSGDMDRAIPSSVVASEVMTFIPQAVLSLLPDCGHLLPLEAPKKVATFIRFATRETRG